MSFVSDQYAGMANDILQAKRDREIYNSQQRQQSNFDTVFRNFLVLTDDQAHVLAQRAALANYIRTLFHDKDAYIPAMDDPSIWESIGKAGVTAWSYTKDWEAVKEAGRTFRLPEGPDIYKDHVPRAKYLKQNDAYMESISNGIESESMVHQLSLKNAEYEKHIKEIDDEIAELLEKSKKDDLSIQALIVENESLTKSLVQQLSQAAAFRHHLSVAVPNHPLVTDSNLREKISKIAYDSLVVDGVNNWNVVRDIGKTFVSNAETLRAIEANKLDSRIGAPATDDSDEDLDIDANSGLPRGRN